MKRAYSLNAANKDENLICEFPVCRQAGIRPIYKNYYG